MKSALDRIRIFAIFATVLMLGTLGTPVVAGGNDEKEIVYLDAEIKVIDAEENPAGKVPIAIVIGIIAALVAIVGGCVVDELGDWWDGRCASPWCDRCDHDFGLFCGHPNCPATIHSFYDSNCWIRS